MRLLFTTTEGSGHLHPLVPVARAAHAAGHDVAFACPTALVPTVQRLGFAAFPTGEHAEHDPAVRQVAARTRQLPHGYERAALAFFGLKPRLMLPDLVAICRNWRPDLLVREDAEFAAPIAAEHLGLPHASVQVNASLEAIWSLLQPAGEHLDAIRQEWGLPPDPALQSLYRHLFLSWLPPRFHTYTAPVPVPPTLHAFRPLVFDRSGDEALPVWAERLPPRPTVYATLGTEMNSFEGVYPQVLRAIAAGLRDEALNVVVTVGRDQDPADLGPQPEHVHVERYIPQSLILPRCDAVVLHGGTGTFLAAIAAGLPMVVVPLMVDQPFNAERCAALSLGHVVERASLTPEAIRAAVRDVLHDPRYGQNVRRLREELYALPGVEHAVCLLERLATEQTPQLNAPYPGWGSVAVR